MKKLLVFLEILVLLIVSSGCGYLVAAGAGAAGGYILKDQGYEVQNPVKKNEDEKKASE